MKLHASGEDYLETILLLQKKLGMVRSVDVARHMEVSKPSVCHAVAEGLLELYKKIRPGEPLSVESAESLINAMFFDPRRYDLAKVGRYKFNKKLALKNRIRHQILAADVVDPSTGEVIASAGDKVTAELADTIQNSAVPFVYIQTEEKNVKVLSNLMVDLTHYVDCNPRDFGIHELVYYPVLAQILEEFGDDPEKLAEAIKKNVHELVPKHITKEDILASINYNMHLEYGLGNDDDIDHLGNRRIRAVGELLQNQYRIARGAVGGIEQVALKVLAPAGLDGQDIRDCIGQHARKLVLRGGRRGRKRHDALVHKPNECDVDDHDAHQDHGKRGHYRGERRHRADNRGDGGNERIHRHVHQTRVAAQPSGSILYSQ